jgi:hypothetical protein
MYVVYAYIGYRIVKYIILEIIDWLPAFQVL